MNNFFSLGIVMLIVGIICGLSNYFRDKEHSWNSFALNILYSIIAAFTVPLFLNLISSELVKTIISGTEIFVWQLFIFIGFCALASLYAKSFLEKMYSKLAEELIKVKKQVTETKNEMQNIQDKFEEKPENIDYKSEKMKSLGEEESKLELMYRVMECIYKSNFVFRSISGILRDAKIEQDEFNAILPKMLKNDFIIARRTKKGDLLFGLGKNGKSIFDN